MTNKKEPTLLSVAVMYDKGKIDIETLKKAYRKIEVTPEDHTEDGVEVREGYEWDNSHQALNDAIRDGKISEDSVDKIYEVINDLFYDEGLEMFPGVDLNGNSLNKVKRTAYDDKVSVEHGG